MSTLKSQSSLSNQNIFSNVTLHGKDIKNGNHGTSSGTSYEVFRNNSTAVEVIVKEVTNKNKNKTFETAANLQNITVKRLQEDNTVLKGELNKASDILQSNRNAFNALINEMRKQLDASVQREMDNQIKNINLQLENEKLKTLLDNKSKLILKFKRELINMKRVLKSVVKGISSESQISQNTAFSSDTEYEDIKKELRREIRIKFANDIPDGTYTNATLDSTF